MLHDRLPLKDTTYVDRGSLLHVDEKTYNKAENW